MTTFWDPRRVLDVYPSQCGFTCTGITKKGARCRNSFISNADKAEASNILDRLAQKNVVFEDLNTRIAPKLVRLAELTLCPRWHRASHLSQVDSVSLKWHLAVSEFCRAEMRATSEVQNVQYVPIQVIVQDIRSTSTMFQPSPAHASITRPRTQPSHPNPHILAVESASASSRPAPRPEDHRPRPSAIFRESTLPPPPRVELERLNRNTNTRQDQTLRPSQSSQPDLPRNQPDEVSPIPPIVVDQLPTPPQSPRPQRRQPSPHPHLAESVPHVEARTSSTTARRTISQRPTPVTPTRKPLSEACYVCYEPFSGHGDAVWCRASCGQNLHKDCFEQWSSGKSRQNVKCAFCRSQWVY